MINRQMLEGNWNQVKGNIRQRWGQLTGDYLDQFQGNVDELIGVIEGKTGEGREAVESFLQELTQDGGAAIGKAAGAARQYAGEATRAARQAADRVQEGLAGANDLVRARPAQSLAMCFGAGVITGILLSLVLRNK